MLHIGPERDLGLFDGFDVRLCRPRKRDAVVCSGLYDDHSSETPADYAGLLTGLLERAVP